PGADLEQRHVAPQEAAQQAHLAPDLVARELGGRFAHEPRVVGHLAEELLVEPGEHVQAALARRGAQPVGEPHFHLVVMALALEAAPDVRRAGHHAERYTTPPRTCGARRRGRAWSARATLSAARRRRRTTDRPPWRSGSSSRSARRRSTARADTRRRCRAA